MMTLRIMAAAALAAGSMALFAASAARAAETVYPLATVQLYATASGGAAIGSATPGTPLAVTAAAAGGREQVMVEGWSRKGGESVVLQAPGLRILLAKLTPAAVSARKLLGQQTDSYGTVWEHVAVPVWVETNAVVNNLATVWDAAGKLYAARCGACHALHAPDELGANAWPGELRTMAKNAGLSPEQDALITKYLQEHAGKE
jgi:trimethylamine-N-oxide reductase cytochrome c-type subunit TorC